MAQSPKALVDRAVLEWLRSAAGLSTEEAARRIQTKPAKIETWEKGDDRPTMSQLRKLGERRVIAEVGAATQLFDFQRLARAAARSLFLLFTCGSRR